MTAPDLRVRTWVRASMAENNTGLLGFLSVFYGSLILDGIALRRTAYGKYTLSFPARTDRDGRKHSYIRPESDAMRQEIERELLRQLGEREDFEPAAGGRP